MGYDEAFDEGVPRLRLLLLLDEMMTATNVWMITTTWYSMCVYVFEAFKVDVGCPGPSASPPVVYKVQSDESRRKVESST